MKEILLLGSDKYKSLSTLEWCASLLNDFFSDCKKIAFVPYADVLMDYNEYEHLMQNKVSKKIRSIHNDPELILNESDGILVAGGNVFVLLHKLKELNLLNLIKEKINNDTPYAGWGAGASIVSKSIKACYDLPLVYPSDLNALDCMDYQILTEYSAVNHLQTDKLVEFFKLNPNTSLFALPHGSCLKISNQTALVLGNEGIFKLSEHYEQYFRIGDFIKI